MSGERPIDQVARWRRFAAVHPEVRIEHQPETWTWEATYAAGGKGVQIVSDPELRYLLDRLEQVYPECQEGEQGK